MGVITADIKLDTSDKIYSWVLPTVSTLYLGTAKPVTGCVNRQKKKNRSLKWKL